MQGFFILPMLEFYENISGIGCSHSDLTSLRYSLGSMLVLLGGWLPTFWCVQQGMAVDLWEKTQEWQIAQVKLQSSGCFVPQPCHDDWTSSKSFCSFEFYLNECSSSLENGVIVINTRCSPTLALSASTNKPPLWQRLYPLCMILSLSLSLSLSLCSSFMLKH